MLDDYRTLVDALVRDRESILTSDGRDAAIANAVLRYSLDRPIRKVEDVTADDAYFLDLPAGWDAAFSAAMQLEYPIGEIPPQVLVGQDWQTYVQPSGTKLLILGGVEVGADVRVTYTLPHTVSAGEDTIPTIHRDPVAAYAAGLLCRELAAHYSGESDPTIAADTVEHSDQATAFDKRGRELRQRYYEALGVNPKRNAAAGAVVDLDRDPSYGKPAWTRTRRRA